jgi:hypothetical protein
MGLLFIWRELGSLARSLVTWADTPATANLRLSVQIDVFRKTP